MGMRPLKKQVDVLKKFLSLKLVCLAIIVVGLVFYFKPSETKKNPIEKRPSSTKVIHEGNLKNVQLFGEKNQFVLSKDLTLVDGKYLVGFDYVKTDDRINGSMSDSDITRLTIILKKQP